LLLIGGLVLQIVASLREEAFTIEIPASAVTMRPAADAVKDDLRGTPLVAGAGENALRGGPDVAAAALSRATDDLGDAAAQPPSPLSEGVARRQVTTAGDPAAAAGVAAGVASPDKPLEPARPPRIEKIVIGQSEPLPAALGANTLAE